MPKILIKINIKIILNKTEIIFVRVKIFLLECYRRESVSPGCRSVPKSLRPKFPVSGITR